MIFADVMLILATGQTRGFLIDLGQKFIQQNRTQKGYIFRRPSMLAKWILSTIINC
jgi:hypothetical protein